MRIIKVLQPFLCAAVLCVLFGAPANADTWNKKTIVTFADSVEIPGQMLPAGTYVFKLADSLADRHIVQIWTGDETQLLATLITVPEYIPAPPDNPIFEFEERPSNSPMAIHSWFYPGGTFGQQFIYPYGE